VPAAVRLRHKARLHDPLLCLSLLSRECGCKPVVILQRIVCSALEHFRAVESGALCCGISWG
jgi:hypothetical protein